MLNPSTAVSITARRSSVVMVRRILATSWLSLPSGQLVHDRFIEGAEEVLALCAGLLPAQENDHFGFQHRFDCSVAGTAGAEQAPGRIDADMATHPR
jgi:hypothetical protein